MLPAPLATLFERLSPHRFTILLFLLVGNLVAAPVLVQLCPDDLAWLSMVLVRAGFFAVMLGTLFAVRAEKVPMRIAVVLSAIVVVAHASRVVLARTEVLVVELSSQVAFYAFVALLVLRYIFRERRVTRDLICAALCTYVLVGLCFAAVYALIETTSPGSFHLPEEPSLAKSHMQEVEELARSVYFSFVTLLTLGYGDIHPLMALARLVSVMEALLGQIFLVVLVARLVGLQVAQSTSGIDPQ